MRSIAECLGGESATALQFPPPSESAKRSARNAAHLAAGRLGADGESGFVANYRPMDDLAIPPNLPRRGGGAEFLLRDSGDGADRILILGT